MGSVTLNGATSGQITLQPTAVAGTNTVTVAAQTGTLNVAGPAFRAQAGGAQTITNATNTKATLTEDFDTNANFASSRFTPTVEGYYQINAVVGASASTSISYTGALLFKNGSAIILAYFPPSTTTGGYASVSDIVYCNGSTDYIELYARIAGSGTLTITNNTYFSGSLLRGA
jgi:hypothetical protein